MKIFVSAVTKGLGGYRQAVADYLRQRGIEPVEQNAFGIQSKQLEHLLKDLIRGCDGVICLVGPYFGYAPSDNPSRSYTQSEYFTANELQKDIFLFFAADDCPLDPLRPDQQPETPEQRERQRQFREWIETNDKRIRYPFCNRDDLLRKIADAVFDLRRRGATAQPGLAAAVEKQYPTPLAEMHERIEGNAQQLYLLSEDLLRFMGLLALQNAVQSGRAGEISADDVIAPALCDDSPGRHAPWAALLVSASLAIYRPADPHAEAAWLRTAGDGQDDSPQESAVKAGDDHPFVPELIPWRHRHRDQIERILAACSDIVRLQFHDRKLEAQKKALVENLTALLEGLDFLQNYLLVEISATPDARSGIRENSARENSALRGEVFRGIHSKTIQLTGAATPGLYLVNLDRRAALSMTPVLFAEARVQNRGVYGWSVLNCEGENPQLILTPFGDVSPSELIRELRRERDVLVLAPDSTCGQEPVLIWPAEWSSVSFRSAKGEAFCGAKGDILDADFVCGAKGDSAPAGDLRLDDDSWQALEVLAFPERDPRRFLGGRFLVLPPALHAGKHADLIPAADQSAGEHERAEQFLVHQLREETLDDAEVRDWFVQRIERWQCLNHATVLPIEPGSDSSRTAKHPFFAVRQVSGRDLENLLQDGPALNDREILQIIAAAADICQAAHAQGFRLLALPPRHFLLDESGNVCLTGFETLVPADIVRDKSHGWLEQFVRRFSRDGGLVAPEAAHQRRGLEPTVDVYAVGMLLARLKGLAAHPRDWLPLDKWSDPWECFAFHCLAEQPAMRFQSPGQLLTFLRQRLQTGYDPHPRLVEMSRASNLGTANFLGQYPITNREYQAYCADRGLPLPWHLRDLDREESLYNRRLSGPWFPVAFVNLEEGHAYCDWLSARLRQRVRIPSECEWLAAAGETKYPWGDADPNPAFANYDRYYRGPTVVGAFAPLEGEVSCADLAGNVWEWCTDRVFDGTPRRILKGGAYDFAAESLGNTSRWPVLVRHRSGHVGFRVVVEG
jgi:hypothetical protein